MARDGKINDGRTCGYPGLNNRLSVYTDLRARDFQNKPLLLEGPLAFHVSRCRAIAFDLVISQLV